MKILYICHHNPFGIVGGGCIASHAYLKAFCEISEGCLDLICSDSLKEENKDDIRCSNIYYVHARSIIDKIRSVYTGIMTRYIKFTKIFIQEGNHYDFVVFDHSCISGHLVRFFNKKGIKTITIHHNFEPEYFQANAGRFYQMLFLRHVKNAERIAYLNSMINLFLTSSDMKLFEKSYGNTSAKNYYLGGFSFNNFTHSSANHKIHSPLTFVISGSFDCRQSYDGIEYFFNDLYHQLPLNCRVIIAGKFKSKFLNSISSRYVNVQIEENPSDIDKVIREGDIYICPTRLGGGLKFRIMDGLRNGLPIIAHINSARGYESMLNPLSFKVFSTIEDFKECVYSTIQNLDKAKEIESLQYHLFQDNFSFAMGVGKLSQIMKEE